jgi:hypothetical protein
MVKVDDLIKDQEERKKKRNKIYKKIYRLTEKKIIESNKYNSSQCLFEIPYFILNGPIYSVNDCKNYIIKRLTNNGFKITDIDQNKILINWYK